MNKKGVLGLSLNTVLGLFLAIGVILLTATFGGNLYAAFFPELDQVTEGSFKKLTETVEKILDNNNDFVSETIAYDIGNEYVLIGFDKFWDDTKIVSSCDIIKPIYTLEQKEVSKPNLCSDNACLCIFSVKVNKPDKPIKCEKFDGNVIFFAPVRDEEAYKSYPGMIGKVPDRSPGNSGIEREDVSNSEYLFIYGKCGDVIWKPYTLYVEKQEKNDKIYLFIAKETDQIRERYKKLNDYFTICSEESVEQCKGKRLYSACEPTPPVLACSGEYSCKRESESSDKCVCECYEEIITTPLQ